MVRCVALLRGVNLGRARRLAMADLRALLESLGLADVSTLGQSGNAVFTTEAGGPQVAAAIETAIEARLGMRVTVLIRTSEEMERVVRDNPLPEAEAEPSRFHVAFLAGTPSAASVAALDPGDFAPDQFRLGDRVVYAWYRQGILESRLPYVWEKHLGVSASSRNWNTVTRLARAARGGLPVRS